MSDWVKTTLGEVVDMAISAVQVEPQARYDIVGVLNRGRGLLYRDAIMGAETSYKTLNRVEPNQVVYSRLKAFEGAITVASATLPEVYASQEFPTFDCGPSLLPGFFRLLTTTQRMWDALQNLSTGMGGRRERVKPADFLTLPICLPSLAEQRRIVDVVAAVDAQIEALSGEAKRAGIAARLAAEHAVSALPRVPVGAHLLKIEGGRSPMTSGTTPGPEEQGVLKVSAVTPHQFVATESKALYPGTVMPGGAQVQPGDVLITRANTPDRVGAVCRVPSDVRQGLFLCDKTLRLVPKESLDPDFLVVAMGLVTSRKHLTGAATGTSASMFNVSQAKIRSTPIPLPDLKRQRTVARDISTIRSTLSDMQAELSRLRAFRATTLTSLLSQDVKIPESYDDALAAGREVVS